MEVEVRRCRPLLGTFVEIAVRSSQSAGIEDAIEAAFAEVALVHRLMSFHDERSDVSRINRAASDTPVAVNARTHDVLLLARELKAASHGAFDVTIAQHLQRLGRLPHAPRSKNVSGSGTCDLELLPQLRVRKSAGHGMIDLGGIAKGYAVDRAVAVLRQYGTASGLVDAGGDIAVLGDEPWPVAIRDPRGSGLLCGITLAGGALASSAGYSDLVSGAARAPTAIVDPGTGAPAVQLAGATVRAQSCMLADALTKVVMLKPDQSLDLLARYGAEVLAVHEDGELFCTPGWNWEARNAA